MKLKKLFLSFILASTAHQLIVASPVITVFLRPYPEAKPTEYAHDVNNKLQKPGKIAQYSLYDPMTHIPTSVFGTYSGYLALSDQLGQLTFPRKHQAPSLTLVVADKITPIMMLGNTIHHWEIEKDSQAAFYKFERKQDPETSLFYWDVQPTQAPADNILPMESIAIIAKPQHIVVPTGVTLTEDSPHLILPNIYVKRGIEKLSNALYLLNISQFFGPLDTLYKTDKVDRYRSQVKE